MAVARHLLCIGNFGGATRPIGGKPTLQGMQGTRAILSVRASIVVLEDRCRAIGGRRPAVRHHASDDEGHHGQSCCD